MAESKFTSGPLEAKENKWQKQSWEILGGDIYLGVAIETGVEGEAKANAELWADAPRMLEVLRRVLEYSDIKTSWLTIDEAEQAFTEAHEILEKHCG